jgi:hypothetical protein
LQFRPTSAPCCSYLIELLWRFSGPCFHGRWPSYSRSIRKPQYLCAITKMAQYPLNLNILADLTSFSSEDRFSYSIEGGFRVAIPRVSGWDYHRRANVSELKAHLLPDIKITRGGHVSKHQPQRPSERDYRYAVDKYQQIRALLIICLKLVAESANTLRG